MHADHHYEIGTSHQACEDYAISGSHNGLSYALVSDGCSSSKNTDVGARILCHIGKNALQYLYQQGSLWDGPYVKEMFPTIFQGLVVMKALEARVSLGLDYNAFDATLLVAFAAERPGYNPAWGHTMFGDGVIVQRYGQQNNNRRIFAISYTSNAPYYLSYAMSREKYDGYFWSFGDHKRRVYSVLVEDGEQDYNEASSDQLDPMIYPAHHESFGPSLVFPTQISLFSDGIGSLTTQDGKPAMTDITAAQNCTAYKNTVGEFVRRRMRAFSKECASAGFSHYDDLACAAVHLE